MWGRILLIALCLIGLGLVSADAATKTRFGAKLDNQSQPSNSFDHVCNVNANNDDCTWIMGQAYHCEFGSCNHGEIAPKTGIIGRLYLVACDPGTFALQIASVVPSRQQAKVTHTGPQINYQGDPQHCNGNTFKVESFAVNVPIVKGQYLAAVTQKLGFVYCSGGGSNDILLYDLPLADHPTPGGFRKANGHDDCLMLLEAEYK